MIDRLTKILHKGVKTKDHQTLPMSYKLSFLQRYWGTDIRIDTYFINYNICRCPNYKELLNLKYYHEFVFTKLKRSVIDQIKHYITQTINMR